MTRPAILLCADPIVPRRPDAAFAKDAAAAEACGFYRILFDHDALERGDAPGALRRSAVTDPCDAVYRGWMLRAEAYAGLHAALRRRGVRLVTGLEQYALCHHLPEAYAHVGRWMARTTWVGLDRLEDPQALDEALAPFAHTAIVIRDWVKSQAAGYWSEACFISDASDRDEVLRVVGRFRDLQGEAFTGGIVFRAYQPLVRVGAEVDEWRAFILDGTVLGCWPRFSGEPGAPPPTALLDAVASALPCRFATADFARRADGRWLLVETGDGQVSAIPASAPMAAIMAALFAALTGADGAGPAARAAASAPGP